MFIPTLNLISFSLTHTRNRSFRLQKPSMEALQGNRTVFWVQSCIGGEKRPIQCPSDLAKLIWGGTKAILSYGTPELWLIVLRFQLAQHLLGSRMQHYTNWQKQKESSLISTSTLETLGWCFDWMLQSSSVRWWLLPTEKQPLQAHLASHCPYISSRQGRQGQPQL